MKFRERFCDTDSLSLSLSQCVVRNVMKYSFSFQVSVQSVFGHSATYVGESEIYTCIERETNEISQVVIWRGLLFKLHDGSNIFLRNYYELLLDYIRSRAVR
jgi:hypothetical protein